MPWTSRDAKRHSKKASTPKKARQWSDVSNSVLERTGDEGLAIREANSVIKKQHHKRDKHERKRAMDKWASEK